MNIETPFTITSADRFGVYSPTGVSDWMKIAIPYTHDALDGRVRRSTLPFDSADSFSIGMTVELEPDFLPASFDEMILLCEERGNQRLFAVSSSLTHSPRERIIFAFHGLWVGHFRCYVSFLVCQLTCVVQYEMSNNSGVWCVATGSRRESRSLEVSKVRLKLSVWSSARETISSGASNCLFDTQQKPSIGGLRVQSIREITEQICSRKKFARKRFCTYQHYLWTWSCSEQPKAGVTKQFQKSRSNVENLNYSVGNADPIQHICRW